MSDKEQKQKQAKSNYVGQEIESRRIGLQARLNEKVVEAAEDKGCHSAAKAARFATTGEPESAPRVGDVK